MSNTRFFRTFGILMLTAAVAGTALAEVKGRVRGKLTDENGAPVADAQVHVTDPEIASIDIHDVTDGKGKFSFLLVNATRTYQIEISKEGYQSIRTNLKIPAGSSTLKEYTILSAAAAIAQAAADDPGAGAINAFNEAAKLANIGDYATAKSKFEEAIELDSTLAEAHSGLASTLMVLGDPVTAVASAEKALELKPDLKRALKTRLDAYEVIGDSTKAAEARTALHAADPTAAVGDLFKQAAQHYNNGSTDQALPLLQQVIELRPTHAQAHYLLGLTLISSGDTEGAKQHLGTFIELAPNDPDAALAQEMIAAL